MTMALPSKRGGAATPHLRDKLDDTQLVGEIRTETTRRATMPGAFFVSTHWRVLPNRVP